MQIYPKHVQHLLAPMWWTAPSLNMTEFSGSEQVKTVDIYGPCDNWLFSTIQSLFYLSDMCFFLQGKDVVSTSYLFYFFVFFLVFWSSSIHGFFRS